MRNLIYKFETGTDIVIKLYQDTNTKKFAVTEYNKTTNEYNNTEWFFNYQKATDEIKNRMRKYKPEEEKPNFKVYTMDDWRNDGTLKVKVGQCIDDDVFEELSGSVPPRSYSRRCFQPGEAQCPSVDGEELYKTFTNINGNWKYLGLCKGGDTTPQKPLYDNINENKKTIKLTESDLKSIIKESVKRILKEDMDKELMLQKQMKDFYDEDAKLYKELEMFLKRNGVKNVFIKKNNSALSIPTNEYNSNVKKLLNSFASSKNMSVNDNVYPATTTITLINY